jgi:hypothetical protein
MKKDLPIFDIIINDEDLSQGVGRISLVDEPAIGVDWIALKKQPKTTLAKRECLGCPPNGDGTKANGEPDRRCRDTKGEGGAGRGTGKSTASVIPTGKDRQTAEEKIKEASKMSNPATPTADNFGELQAIVERIDASGDVVVDVKASNKEDYEKFKDKIKSEMNTKPVATGEKPSPKIGQYASGTQQLLDEKFGKGWENKEIYKIDTFETNRDGTFYVKDVPHIKVGDKFVEASEMVTKSPSKSDYSKYQYTFSDGENSIFSHNAYKRRSFVKTTLAKRECLGCPPNGDGTRVNGEPDGRCRDNKGGGAGAGRGAGAGKAPKGVGKTTSTKEPTKVPSGTPPLNVPTSVQSLAAPEKWNEETQEYWSNPDNVQAVKDKDKELNTREQEIREKMRLFNEKLSQYPEKNGRYQIPLDEEPAIRAEQKAISDEKAQWDKEKQAQYRLNSVVSEIDKLGGAEAVGRVKEVVAERKAAEAERIRVAEEKKAEAQRASQKRIEEENEIKKIATVAIADRYGDTRGGTTKAAEEAYKSFTNASDVERRAMRNGDVGSAGGSFKTAWIREDTESEDRFVPNKPILKLDGGDDKKKYDNLTFESKRDLMATIKDVPRNGDEGQHIMDVTYNDGTKSTLRIITDSTRIGTWEDGINVQYSWIYNWDY